jgi:hypothetical protein
VLTRAVVEQVLLGLEHVHRVGYGLTSDHAIGRHITALHLTYESLLATS